MLSTNGGSKKKILNFSINFFSNSISILLLINFTLSNTDKTIKFLSRISAAFLSFSIKVILAAPLDKDSIPKEPIPEYKSRIFEFLIFTLKNLECSKMLKMLSLTESLSGLVL